MMIDEKMIQKAVGERLRTSGFSVTANEVTEGFKKPTTFVTVMPVKSELLNSFRENLVVSVTITYHSQKGTPEECADAAIKIRKGFAYEPLIVAERKLTIENMEFDNENNVLYAFFDLDFIQETTNTEDADDTFAELEMEGL